MPAQVGELKVRNVPIRLHRAGRGPTVLFLHGPGGVPQWLPFFEALAERYLKSAIVGLRSAPRSILRRR